MSAAASHNGRLYLVDASIYVYRGFKRLPSTLVDREGVQANAVRGFVDSLLSLFESESPRYIACAFDPVDNARARRAIDPDYKRHRKPRPPELISQFARARQWCEAVGVPHFEPPGQEADDVVAALAELARARRLPVTVVSADKDLAQVVRPGDELWEPGDGRRLQYGRLRKRLGVAPEQLPDLLALCGDKADNIAGVPGLGPRMAARLLARWGDLATLADNLDAVGEMKFRGAREIAPVLRREWPRVLHARRLTGALPVAGLPGELKALARRPVGDWRAQARALALPERSVERWRQVLA